MTEVQKPTKYAYLDISNKCWFTCLIIQSVNNENGWPQCRFITSLFSLIKSFQHARKPVIFKNAFFAKIDACTFNGYKSIYNVLANNSEQ